MMKKGYGSILLILVVLFFGYNIIVGWLNLERTTSFCITYVFASLAILLQFGIVYLTYSKHNHARSIFLTQPTAMIGAVHLFMQLIMSSLVLAKVNIQPLLALQVSAGFLAFCLISVVITSIARSGR